MSKLQDDDNLGLPRRFFALAFVLIFVLIFVCVALKPSIDKALDDICTYIEGDYLTKEINTISYARNMKEYTIRALNGAQEKSLNAQTAQVYEDAYKSLQQAEKYLEICSWVIYDYKLKDCEVAQAYREAFEEYILAQEHIKKLNNVK